MATAGREAGARVKRSGGSGFAPCINWWLCSEEAGLRLQHSLSLQLSHRLTPAVHAVLQMQVAGFERNQLSSLFTGIMSHLLAHVSDTIQQQQQQESATAPAGRQSTHSSSSKRQAGNTSPAEPGAAAAVAVDVQAYCQHVAAALAAHVSGRLPVSSSLVPHVLHILGPQVRLLCSFLTLQFVVG